MKFFVCLGMVLPWLVFGMDTHPDCTYQDSWPVAMSGVKLKNAGMTARAGGFDDEKIELIASQKIDDRLYRQVHKVEIVDGSKIFHIITVHDASLDECSESEPEVYIVSEKL